MFPFSASSFHFARSGKSLPIGVQQQKVVAPREAALGLLSVLST
jgi:hypothetical protein